MHLDEVPNYILHPPTHNAPIPQWPHIQCCDGWAWHPHPHKRACFQGVTAAPAESVARIVDPAALPVDRVWTVHELLERYPGIVAVFWPCPCQGCEWGHVHDAGNWRRAARAIHPDALDALREANPPLRLLLDLDVEHKRVAKRSVEPGIPVRDTPARTLAAQLSWAADLLERRAQPIRRPRRHPVDPRVRMIGKLRGLLETLTPAERRALLIPEAPT